MALAELEEETGLTTGRLRKRGYLHCSNGMTAEGVHVFHATDLTAGEPRREVTEQDKRHQWFSRSQVERMLRDGMITDAPSAPISLLALH